MMPKRYAEDGCRLTDCCGAYSTYSGAILCCKSCWEEVPDGQGDGEEEDELWRRVFADHPWLRDMMSGDYIFPVDDNEFEEHPIRWHLTELVEWFRNNKEEER